MEFQERCEGQPWFHDAAAHLERFGLVFARFLNLPEMPPYRGPLEFRGDGFHTSADALFLRRPRVIAERFGARRERALREPLLTAIAHGQIEFALLARETFDADLPAPARMSAQPPRNQAETIIKRRREHTARYLKSLQ